MPKLTQCLKDGEKGCTHPQDCCGGECDGADIGIGTCSTVVTPTPTSAQPAGDPTLPPPPSPPCDHWDKGQCTQFLTDFGAISTDPALFISQIFAVLLSVSGGIALLLIIRAGYRITTSQGKPEAIQQGREELIAAIVGLMFLIFSFVILQVIGFDILRIPTNTSTTGGTGTANPTPPPRGTHCPTSCVSSSICNKNCKTCYLYDCAAGTSCCQ